MEIDVEKLINLVRKYPPIYNPDNKDFSNKEIRDNIFNTVISEAMDGIAGELLSRKWDNVLNKYASFIRKLSNDDSSENVLEQFMEWPWTRHMRIFKPYVRKQFQIPEFKPSVQVLEMNREDLPQDFPESLLRPELAQIASQWPRVENALRSAIGSELDVDNNQSVIRNIIISMLGLDYQSDDEEMDTDDNDADDEIETDEEANNEEPNPEQINQQKSFENAECKNTEQQENCITDKDFETNPKNDTDVLPDLSSPEVEVTGPLGFTAHELQFLHWGKKMSTFTAKRQAKVKTKISEIMSEAEFEDLDEEFFAAKTPPHRTNNECTSRQ